MNTITKKQIIALVPDVRFNDWKDRVYLSFDGLKASKLWLDKNGKLHFEIGRGLNSTEANKTIELLLGCEITSRYNSKNDYIVL